MKAGLVVLSALVLVAGAAAAAGPAVQLTKSGNARAKSALMMLADLGEGWGATATRPTPPVLTCRGHSPSFAGIVEKGVASSPTFSLSSTGPFIVQQTSVYASPAQTSAAWRRAVGPALASCAAQTLEGLVSKGIRVEIVSRKPLRVTKTTPHTAAYRLVATLVSQKQTLKEFFDVIYVSRGHALSSVTLSSFDKPVPAFVENAVAKLVAARST